MIPFGERFAPEWVDVALAPEPTKSTTSVPNALKNWLRLGVPLTREVTAADVDADAAAQLRADTDHRYHLVQLACSLRPPDGEKFRRAFLAVSLGAEDSDATIAYSMDPSGDVAEVSQSTKLGLSADLGLVSVSAEHERAAGPVATVVAYGARSSRPTWELRSAGGRELNGSYLFAILTRTQRGVTTTCDVSLSATIERWRFLRFEAALPDEKKLTFAVDGSSR